MNVGWIYSQFYNGVIFQVAVDVVRKKKTVSEVLATGGRYDHLVRLVVIIVAITTFGVNPFNSMVVLCS